MLTPAEVMALTLPPASADARERVASSAADDVAEALAGLGFPGDAVDEARAAWSGLLADAELADLLERVVTAVEAARGDPTAPLSIWEGLDGRGDAGRLFYHCLIGVEAPAMRAHLASLGVPDDVVAATGASFVRHGEIYRRVHGRVGMDDGWWQLLALRGELLDVGRLQYHRLVVGESPLWPSPWYDDDEAAALGPGFRRGDASVGLHIPEGPGFTPDALDASLERAREVLAVAWPTDSRRLATCMSWLLDDALAGFLAPSSHILAFQRRFTMVPGGHDDDYDTLKFVFRSPTASLDDLPQATALQRGIVARLRAGEHWRARVGWLDFDVGS